MKNRIYMQVYFFHIKLYSKYKKSFIFIKPTIQQKQFRNILPYFHLLIIFQLYYIFLRLCYIKMQYAHICFATSNARNTIGTKLSFIDMYRQNHFCEVFVLKLNAHWSATDEPDRKSFFNNLFRQMNQWRYCVRSQANLT